MENYEQELKAQRHMLRTSGKTNEEVFKMIAHQMEVERIEKEKRDKEFSKNKNIIDPDKFLRSKMVRKTYV